MEQEDAYTSRRGLLLTAAGVAGAAALMTNASPPSPSPVAVSDVTRIGPDTFPGIDNTGTRDTTDALRKAIAGVPTGSTAVIAPGRYILSGTINQNRGDIGLHGYGATLVQAGTSSVISCSAEWPEVHSVISVQAERDSSGQTLGPLLTLATPTRWLEGQLVKVISDDEIPEARPSRDGLASRLGEYAVIAEASGRAIRLSAPLRDSFQTNVRVLRVPDATIDIRGFTIESTRPSATEADRSISPLIFLSGLRAPTVADIRCDRASGIVVQMSGCFAYTIDHLDVGYAPRSPDDEGAGYGYAVLDNACSYGTVRSSTMRRVRHAYSDDTPRIPAMDPSYSKYGRTFGTKVVECSSLGASSSAFDTHHASQAVHFIACSVDAGGPGTPAFSLRGKEHIVDSCRASNLAIGIRVFCEGQRGGRSYGHIARGLTLANVARAVVADINPPRHPQAGERQARSALWMTGLSAEGCQHGVEARNAFVEIFDSQIQLSKGSADRLVGVRTENSRVSIMNSRLSVSPANETPADYILSAGAAKSSAPDEIELRDVVVERSVSDSARTFVVGESPLLRATSIEFSLPFANGIGNVHDTSAVSWACRYSPEVRGSDASSAAYEVRDELDERLPVWVSVDPTIRVEMVTSGRDHVAAGFRPGRRRSQRLEIWVTGEGGSVLFRPGSREDLLIATATGSEVRVAAGASIAFHWTGDIWRQQT